MQVRERFDDKVLKKKMESGKTVQVRERFNDKVRSTRIVPRLSWLGPRVRAQASILKSHLCGDFPLEIALVH